MKIIYKPENFSIDELVPMNISRKYNEDLLWSKFNPDFLRDLQHIRNNVGRIVINNGARLNYSGYRPYDCKIGAKLSDHREWRAFDLHPVDYSPREVYDWILAHKHEFLKLNCVEDIELTEDGGWVHISYRPNLEEFMIIR